MASRPILTEPGVKYFLGETLKNCRKNKFTRRTIHKIR